MDDSFVKVGGSPEVRTYRAHVSSKYLELTRKKLEVTRLPHDLTLDKGREWEMGTPKSIIEPLVDYWLETYDWRGQEQLFNDTLPQFRVSITPPGGENKKPLRIHFIHIKSPSRNAIPLLVLPSFPFTNLSFSPLFAALHSPADGGQAYDIVVPSIPGLGFSDPFNTSPSDPLLASTAYIFNHLMSILGYGQYLATGTGSAAASPANIDYHLPRLIAERYRSNCLGIHIIDPAVLSPSITGAPLSYLKYSFAKFFHASIFGYTAADWAASTRRPSDQPGISPPSPAELDATTITEPQDGPPRRPGIDRQATGPSLLKRPVFSTTDEATRLSKSHLSGDLTLTLAYALCDSPTGMLSLALLGLERICPNHTLTKVEITTILQLAWLPGPEAALRLWSGADAEVRKEAAETTAPSGGGCPIAITAFEGALGDSGSFRSPVWAENRHRVVHISRRKGLPGLPWENAETIVAGVRELSKAVWKQDGTAAGGLQEAVSYMEGREKQDGFFDAGEELGSIGDALQRPQMSERDMGSSDTAVPTMWTPEGGLSRGGSLEDLNGRLETEEEYITDQELAGTWKGDSKGKKSEKPIVPSEKSKGKQKEEEKAVRRKKGRRLQRRMGVEGWGYIWEE